MKGDYVMNKVKKFGVVGLIMLVLAMVVVFSNNKFSAEASSKKEYTVKLYKGNANCNGFVTKNVKINNLTAYSIIKELKAYGAVAPDVKANSLEFKGKFLTLDLSKEFAEDISRMGTAGEYIKVGCVVNTFLDAYNASEITITVNGEAWETGHTVYDFPMTKFN